MLIDLHIHSNNSDGDFSVQKIIQEAQLRHIEMLAITDHDSVDGQPEAFVLAKQHQIRYISGVEINITIQDKVLNHGKALTLDILGYGFNIENSPLVNKLKECANHRINRAQKILANLNRELDMEGKPLITPEDMATIQKSADGVLGRPHIAKYLIQKGIVATIQEGFEKYLTKCDVPKLIMPFKDTAKLIQNAGGKVILAHPDDHGSTSLNIITSKLDEQTALIEQFMKDTLDGIECWHLRHSEGTRKHYEAFIRRNQMIGTGGSDCHQNPITMGTANVPNWVVTFFS